MALYDQRTFKWRDSWWVAEVHAAAGAGTGAGRAALFFEHAMFTSLSEPSAPSRSARIPAGALNRLSHRSLGTILDSAERMVSRFSMSPRNAPDADEFLGTPQFEDKDGLHWVYREVKQPIWTPQGGELRPALELICLDDSALRGEVVFNDSDTMHAYLTMHGDPGVRELVPLVTREFQELEPDWL